MDEIFDNKTNILCGTISLLIGSMLFLKGLSPFTMIQSIMSNSFNENIKMLVNLIFFNYSFDAFDVENINNFTLVCDSYFETIMNYSFIGLNTLPLLCNYFIKKRILKIPFVLYPSPLSISTITAFFCFFKNTSANNKYTILLEVLCYLYNLVTFTNDLLVWGLLSYEHIFMIILNVFNIVFIYLYSASSKNYR